MYLAILNDMKRVLMVIGFLLLSGFSFAQEVKLEAYAPSLVGVGEQFRLVYSINKQPSSFNQPEIKDFEILAGPSTSQSTSVTVINGKVSRSETISYTYILEAKKEGKFTINPASVMIGNDEYKSKVLNIEVINQSNSNQQQSQGAGEQEQNVEKGDLPNSELFVTLDVDRRTSFIGEPIIATLKICTRIDIAQYVDAKFPAFNGFWSQEIEPSPNFSYQRVNINGKIYSVGVIKKFMLFPQKNGTIEIDPWELEILYQQKVRSSQSIFDDFFGSVETYRKRLVSKPVSIFVKELPSNAPESFKGGVGVFKLEPVFDKKSVKTNEAITLRIKVSGEGNIKLIEAPKVEFPSGFEVYDPKVTDKVANSSSGASGAKLFEYVAIPRSPGSFTIPPIEFTYFDPHKAQYITLKSQEYEINVSSDGSSTANASSFTYSKEDIKFIGKDIRFIKTGKLKVTPYAGFFVGSGMFYVLMVLIFLCFGALIYLMSKHQEEMSNIMLIKNKKANKVARKRLQVAESHLKTNNREPFFEEIHKAMWGYLSDKLSIPVSNLTSETARIEMSAKGIADSDIEEFMRIIGVCEYARFAPSTETSEMSSLYNSAIELISKFEQNLKK